MGIGRGIRAALAGMALAWLGLPALGQDMSALARMDAGGSAIFGTEGALQVTLALSQPVPWRLRFLDGPPRLILDFREVDFAALDKVPVAADAVVGLRAGVFRQGWSRLVMELAGPMKVVSAEMVTGAATQLKLHLAPDDPTDFARLAAAPEPPEWSLPKAATLPAPVKKPGGPLVVVLDPGHGGIDPGQSGTG